MLTFKSTQAGLVLIVRLVLCWTAAQAGGRLRKRISNIEQGISNIQHRNVLVLGTTFDIGHSLLGVRYSKILNLMALSASENSDFAERVVNTNN